MSPRRIAIIGGGLTGLAAAHRLGELCPDSSEVEVTLLEASDRLGGGVGTVRDQGYLVDTGADSFLTNKPGALDLCLRLGLRDQLRSTDPKYRGALVLCDGRIVPVPEGYQLISPTAIWPVLTSPIFSLAAKLRMVQELFVPARTSHEDESLSDFTRRRFGEEVLDRLVQPLVGGIYTSNPDYLSMQAALPRFVEWERKYGSLLRAAWKTRREPDADTSSGARYGLFSGLKNGMQQFVNALVSAVTGRAHIRLSSPVSSIEKDGTQFLVHSNAGEERFDAVIVTTPAYRSGDLLTRIDSYLAELLKSIPYASSAIVISGHELTGIRHPLNAFGLVIPHRERRRILAVSFSSRKFPERAPEGRVILRTFVGGAMQPEYFDLDDDAMKKLVLEELGSVLGVTSPPDFMRVCRYPKAMPQFHVGHLKLVDQIENRVAAIAGLEVAGNAYRGVGVPDAVHSGEQAAERIAKLIPASGSGVSA